MNSLDLIKMGLNNLWRRKTRTFLTVLGVVIGTTAIIVMVSLGIAVNLSFEQMLGDMGDLTTIEVYEGWGGPGGGGGGGGGSPLKPKLNDASMKKIEGMEYVMGVMGIKQFNFRIVLDRYVADINVIGVDPKKMEVFGFKADKGRILMDGDEEAIVFGSTIPMRFYNPRDQEMGIYNQSNEPLVDVISDKFMISQDSDYGLDRRTNNTDPNYKPPNPHKVKGVGILKATNDEPDWNVYMSFDYLNKILEDDSKTMGKAQTRETETTSKYGSFKVKVDDIDNVVIVQDKLKKMGYEAWSKQDWLEQMKKQSQMMQAILGGLGAISLFVAALGITNTMIMSIYERTREIGVMKVIGAQIKDIKRLFLFESGMIGFMGGIAGAVLSYMVSWALNNMNLTAIGDMGLGGGGGQMSVIPPWLVLFALLFSTLVGLISGYSPARRAMKLSALQAIKTE